MKMKKIFAMLIVVFMLAAMLPFSAMNTSALEVNDKINEVELTIPEPKAGNTVNRDFSSVEVKHHQTYKVVGMRWYKNNEPAQLGVEDGADTYYIGGNCYTVEIDLVLKGDHEWDVSYQGYDTDYSNIHATINGNEATVKQPPINADQHKTITVYYEFKYIDDGVVNYPILTIPTPIAGNTAPTNEEVELSNLRAIWIPSSEYLWYVYENNAWRTMEYGEHYVAGARYKVELSIVAHQGFCFNLEKAADYRNDGGLQIWGYINGEKRTMEVRKLGENINGEPYYDNQCVYVTYEFTSCEAQYVDSVYFEGITPPSATQHPQYNIPSMTGPYTLFDDEEYIGGAQFNFVNGIQWSSVNGILDPDSVFEEGIEYSMTFFVKTFDTHLFTDWVEGSSNVGYINVMVIPDDPSVAMVTVTFAPCDGGVLNEINISGVKNPVHGEAPDYEFTYGRGYDKGTSDEAIRWYDLTAERYIGQNETFIYGHEYELRVVLRSEKQILGASNGKFEFAPHDSLTVYVNGRKAERLAIYNNNPESNWVEVAISFECEKHTIEQVVVNVEYPKEGQIPATQLTKGDDTYNVDSFMFVDCDTDVALKADDVFEANKTYRFVLAVTPKEGFTFENGITTARVNGQEASVIYAGEEGALISYSFIAEEAPFCFITFNAGEGGEGHMDDVIIKGSMLFVLPECEFEAPEGKVFIGWSADGGETILLGISYYLDGVPTWTLTAVYANPEEEHEHVYPSTYNAWDDVMHWKTCLVGGCDSNVSASYHGNHNYDNACDDTCNDCGYVRTVLEDFTSPLHFYEYGCSEVCPNCGLVREVVHTPGAPASCTDAQECTVCHKVLEEAKGHTPGTEADCGHDQKCTVCDAVLAEANGEHTPGAAATCTKPQNCTVCGAELNAANGHSAGVEWITDENGHHKLCACGEKIGAGEHTDTDGDELCDACGYDMSEGMSGLAIALIIIGSVMAAGVGGFALLWFVIKKKSFADLIAVFKKDK